MNRVNVRFYHVGYVSHSFQRFLLLFAKITYFIVNHKKLWLKIDIGATKKEVRVFRIFIYLIYLVIILLQWSSLTKSIKFKFSSSYFLNSNCLLLLMFVEIFIKSKCHPRSSSVWFYHFWKQVDGRHFFLILFISFSSRFVRLLIHWIDDDDSKNYSGLSTVQHQTFLNKEWTNWMVIVKESSQVLVEKLFNNNLSLSIFKLRKTKNLNRIEWC